jgi:hypothetical protein
MSINRRGVVGDKGWLSLDRKKMGEEEMTPAVRRSLILSHISIDELGEPIFSVFRRERVPIQGICLEGEETMKYKYAPPPHPYLRIA